VNSAVLEVLEVIAQHQKLALRDVISRTRKAGVEFRTETNHSFTGEPKEDLVLLGYAYQGLFYPWTDEGNRKLLPGLVMGTATPADRVVEKAPEKAVVPT